MKVHIPPFTPDPYEQSFKLFIAGTIEMGTIRDWQQEIIDFLKMDFAHQHLDVYNPRRPDWNPNWGHKHPQLVGQIKWERKYLKEAHIITMALFENSKSPISLLELGEYKDKICFIYCPHEFYRKTNIEIFCSDNNIQVIEDWDIYKIALKRLVDSHLIYLA
jgi:hypothetical protein